MCAHAHTHQPKRTAKKHKTALMPSTLMLGQSKRRKARFKGGLKQMLRLWLR